MKNMKILLFRTAPEKEEKIQELCKNRESHHEPAEKRIAMPPISLLIKPAFGMCNMG